MDKEKGRASGKENEKERTLDSIMKRKLPVSGMQKGNGKGNAAATTRLPRKMANDCSNAPIAELLYRVKKKPPPRRLPDPAGAGVCAAITAASGSANYYEKEATSSQVCMCQIYICASSCMCCFCFLKVKFMCAHAHMCCFWYPNVKYMCVQAHVCVVFVC